VVHLQRRAAQLAGRRVMIVEDEFLLALTLEDDIRDAGADPLGPYATLSETLAAIEKENFDLAVLDINLDGEMSYPAADALVARNVPFVLLTGYAGTSLPERFRGCPRLSKPYDVAG
jgi:DNA-binding response OmpR family regulator